MLLFPLSFETVDRGFEVCNTPIQRFAQDFGRFRLPRLMREPKLLPTRWLCIVECVNNLLELFPSNVCDFKVLRTYFC